MKKLLIVDDDALIRATLHTIVDWNELGYEVAGDAQNGEQALQILKKEQIDLVFTDMKMPVMGGLEATRKIRDFDTKIPIIALTANAFDSDRTCAIEAGCNAFLAKPVKKRQLLDLVTAQW